MTPMQFVACGDESCPLNESKSCRAPFIAIDENGQCMIRENGPFLNKSQTENYVEIRECRCQKCNHWEKDQATEVGTCGLREDLFFNSFKNEALGPKCSALEKQIEKPGFSAPNV